MWVIISRKMRVAGHVACIEKRNAYKVWVGKPKGKRPLGRFRQRYVILKWILKK